MLGRGHSDGGRLEDWGEHGDVKVSKRNRSGPAGTIKTSTEKGPHAGQGHGGVPD